MFTLVIIILSFEFGRTFQHDSDLQILVSVHDLIFFTKNCRAEYAERGLASLLYFILSIQHVPIRIMSTLTRDRTRSVVTSFQHTFSSCPGLVKHQMIDFPLNLSSLCSRIPLTVSFRIFKSDCGAIHPDFCHGRSRFVLCLDFVRWCSKNDVLIYGDRTATVFQLP